MTKIVLHIVSGDLWAGKETQLLLQLKPFLSETNPKFSIHFLLFNEGEVSSRLREEGFDCVVLSEGMSRFEFLRQLKTLLSSLKPALVVAHGYKESAIGWLACRAICAPLVTMFHGAPEPFDGLAGVKMSIYTALHRLIARWSAARIVTVSEALAGELGFKKNNKRRVIRNVVDPQRGVISAVERALEDRPAWVAVGRLTPVKAFDRALLVFSQFRMSYPTEFTSLYLIGEGPLRSALELLARELGISERVKFLGFRRDAADLIAEADLLLLPSVREGIPTVVLEAIRAGVPILSNELPGVREALSYFPHYPVVFADSTDSRAWSNAASTLVGKRVLDNSKYIKVLEAEFSPAVAAAKHLALVSELI